MQAERLQSPTQYTYSCRFFGKEPNPVILNRKWQEYMDQAYYVQLQQACKATGSIAVSSRIMTRREKEQNKDRRYQAGREVYYLFPADAVPLSIFAKLPTETDELIFGGAAG